MSPGTSPESSSPRGSDRKVRNGRIEKSKKGPKKPTYRIGGRTYACEACKKGHRVSKCTHASERPVSMTNDPGRPSGDQKRHCDCPKQCACTKKNCKCDRNCSCTQTMFMLVYVPMKEGNKVREGEWQIGQEVITDLQGKKLTEEEIRARNELKQMQQTAKNGVIAPGPLKPSPSTSNAGSPQKSCCQHKKNIEEQKQSIPAPEDSTVGQRRPQCNCGTGCACAFCLDHPNNQTSHLLAQQQAAYFSNQSYCQQQMHPSWAPLEVAGSCMGTNPRFAISSTPNPSQSQFQTLFPAAGPANQGGYFISYPFTKYSGFVEPALAETMHSPVLATPMSAPPSIPYATEGISPSLMVKTPASSCCHPSTENGTPTKEEPVFDAFDFSSYDIGDAVASGWNGADQFAFDSHFDAQLPTFSTDSSWDPTTDMFSSINDPPIPEDANIEPPVVSAPRASIAPNSLSHAPNMLQSLNPVLLGNCSHQFCCQHGLAHQRPQVLHQGLQNGMGMAFHNVPTTMIQNVYAHSPS